MKAWMSFVNCFLFYLQVYVLSPERFRGRNARDQPYEMEWNSDGEEIRKMVDMLRKFFVDANRCTKCNQGPTERDK